MTDLPCMQPTGWFQVAWGTDIAPGDVKPLKYFGADLVMFRDLEGAVHVLDAHCAHLGAHLGYGGCVVEGGVQCPFHGWVWSGAGRNVSIPYDRPNRAKRMRAWPVAEVNECVFVWHDALGREPLWQLPAWHDVLSEAVTSQSYRPLGADEKELFSGVHVHPQIIAENAVDPHHFRFVHRTPISPVVLTETTDECSWHAKVGFGKRWEDGVDRPGDSKNTIELYWSGIGYSITGECTPGGVRMVAINATPVDQDSCDIFASYWVSGDNDYSRRLEEAKVALPDDVRIWQHQKYNPQPALAPSEAAGFTQLRRWAQGFYPQPAEA